jgi:hypothetical protein
MRLDVFFGRLSPPTTKKIARPVLVVDDCMCFDHQETFFIDKNDAFETPT